MPALGLNEAAWPRRVWRACPRWFAGHRHVSMRRRGHAECGPQITKVPNEIFVVSMRRRGHAECGQCCKIILDRTDPVSMRRRGHAECGCSGGVLPSACPSSQ